MTNEEGFTKLSFNATERTVAALHAAADMLGLSKTDTANRALQIYASLLALDEGNVISVDHPGGPDLLFGRLSSGSRAGIRRGTGAKPNAGRPERCIIVQGIGGYVCAMPDPDRPDGICGMPTESEPCDQHGEAPR